MPVTPRLRSACDACHQLKVRCSGYLPCDSCTESCRTCVFSMSNRLGRPLGSKNKRAAAAGGRETQSLANQKSAARNKGPREARKARKRSSIHLENQVTLSPRPIIATQSIAGPASVPSDNSSSPKSNGQSPFTDVNSMSWATSPFEFSLPFPEDKWGLQEDFASADMTRGLFHHEETFEKEHDPTFSEASAASQSELAHLFAIPPTTVPVSADLSQSVSMSQEERVSNTPSPLQHSSVLTCTCLQQQTSLLCKLRGSEVFRPGGKMSMKSILANMQEAQTAWLGLTSCTSCMRGDDQEVLILALMCVRSMLLQLQNVSWACGGNQDVSLTASEHVSPGISAEGDVELEVVTVGDFELTGDDKSSLLYMLWSMMVQKVNTVLESFRSVLERKKVSGGRFSEPGALLSGDLSMVEHTIDGLTHLSRSILASPRKTRDA
ncbi:hypothetical protein CI102_1714 [Trichoderma harzianum]|uniref:Zn(2)-C6 fungal-type domain-containing protein n=1 Tax=Trichoderma harzianum CBS 226.95 TaxID=983964 RepID=A0A2T3ZVZ3_TRIHA|nr:hypothetical protein M431DRAFT_535173 [Trichoderma harzianum CBS 226.95]PKK54268.1 hypothetical protein CI102_1714 [Trichoderma harzianum]PTB48981.1 hypothetical protein M431DRAFT_535173 [Trichoderma harzianum CBS 226.95]